MAFGELGMVVNGSELSPPLLMRPSSTIHHAHLLLVPLLRQTDRPPAKLLLCPLKNLAGK